MTTSTVEHFDVLIVGAGISGVGSAYQLLQQCPATRFVILEAEESFGGTWWTHRFPGIRSDSDLHTFGYSFKPWVGPPIATAEEIRCCPSTACMTGLRSDVGRLLIKSVPKVRGHAIAQQFFHRPHVVRQTCRHRRRDCLPLLG